MDRTLANIVKTIAKYPEVVEKEPDLITDLMRLASVMFLNDFNLDTMMKRFDVTDDEAKIILTQALEELDEDKLIDILCWIREQFIEDTWEYPDQKYVS